MRAGFRSILPTGGYRQEPRRLPSRRIGSRVSDSLAGYRDMELFEADVREAPRARQASGEEAANRRS